MDNRKHQRMAMEDLSVDVADGIGFFKGMINDVSRYGLCLTNLSKHLNGDAGKMTVLVSGRENHFRMNVIPRWYTHGSARKTVGVEIVTAPAGWLDFIMGFEPTADRDDNDDILI